MRLVIILVFALLISTPSVSQSNKQAIKKEAETFYGYMVNMNLDGVLDYMHPKMFDLASRAQMKAGMEQMFNSPEMKIEFISNHISSITNGMEEAGITYAVVFYDSKMRMTFLIEKDKTTEEQKEFLEIMESTMATQFGENNVSVDEASSSLVINNHSSMFAIKDPNLDGWKFLRNQKNMVTFVDSIVPEAIRTALLKKEQ